MTGRALIVCKSISHGNTRLVADRIAEALGAEVIDPDENACQLDAAVSLIGIGSGIYYARFHRSIRRWLKSLPKEAGRGRLAFVFSTSGLPFLSKLYHLPLVWKLKAKGFHVIAQFSCRGHDTFGPLCLIGGLNRKHPNDRDLGRAEVFGERLTRESGLGEVVLPKVESFSGSTARL